VNTENEETNYGFTFLENQIVTSVPSKESQDSTIKFGNHLNPTGEDEKNYSMLFGSW
jgi:hypothetical protein